MRWIPTIVVVVVLAGCSSDEPPSPTPGGTPGLSPLPPASPPPSSAPADPVVDRLVVPAAAPSVSAPWAESFVIPYGADEDQLGTSRGGDAGTLDIGPEYGAPGPDGTWWFLDVAKQRLAHYSADGNYLDQVRVPSRLLIDRRYFQWQLPHVLGDGTLYASRLTFDEGTQMLRMRDGVLDEVPVKGDFVPTYDDGRRLFGGGEGSIWAAWDPTTGELTESTTLSTPSGTPFSVMTDFDRGRLLVELPDSEVSASIPIRTASGARAHVGMQVRVGADDVLHLFLYGAGEDDESVQLVGYTRVFSNGAVASVEPLADPFSRSDPGSPAHLVIAPGSTTPMLVYVLEDGVHVYARTG